MIMAASSSPCSSTSTHSTSSLHTPPRAHHSYFSKHANSNTYTKGKKRKYRDGSSSSTSDSVSEGSRHRHKKWKEKNDKKDKEKHKERVSERHRHKHHKLKEKSCHNGCSPMQLSKFLGRTKENGVRRSVVSGKKILMKVEKSKEDKMAENKRNELLKFLNASYD